ncbi:MAG: flippase [Candidatus Aenigmarchaeota archaeon]|nr:flippase [Candidatus Aenigmarchaeota archaeon]
MEKIRNAVSNSYIVLSLTLLGIFFGYLLRIYLSRNLTLEDFGLFYAVSAFIGLFTLVRYLGLNQALAKFIPEFLIRRQKGDIKSSISAVFMLQAATIVAFTLLIFIFREQISISLFKSSTAEPVLLLMTLSFFPSMFFTIFQSVFQGYQRLKLYASVEPVRIGLTFIFSVLLISYGATGVAAAYLIAACATTLVFFKKFHDIGAMKVASSISFKLTRKLLKFSIPVFVSSIAVIIISFTDTLIITFYRTLPEVALYQVALPTSQLLLVFSGSIAAVAFPLISELYSRKRFRDVQKGVRAMSVLLLVMVMPFVALLVTFPDAIIGILFSESFLPASLALRVLSISMVFYSLFVIFQTTIDGIGKPVITTKIMFAMAAVNLVLNFSFVPALGITGSAFASLLAYVTGVILGMRYLKKENIQLPGKRIGKIIFSAIVSGAAMHATRIALDMNIYLEFAIALIVGFSVYIISSLAVKAISYEDVEFLESKGSMPKPIRKFTRIIFRKKKEVVV